MTTSGAIIALGEKIDGRATLLSNSRSRSFKHWKMLWGLGAQLPIPDGDSAQGYTKMDERIVSFSWAREIGPGRGMLAYLNDADHIVVMGVQFYSRSRKDDPADTREGWEIFEVGRFDAKGPHTVSR